MRGWTVEFHLIERLEISATYLEYGGFLGPPNFPWKWNNGRVECWNIGFQKDINHFKFIVNPAGGGTIDPTLLHPRTHYSTIPLFHHSLRGVGATLRAGGQL